ncbi:Phd finger protein 10 [Fasciola gigantica]|uniref:Phd finger protein 10 n=1 Tax=Fasciola gigantica TaxID=46835 RepID=A0A504YX83_FASGI|nr:Phd finger protein 10 [Fasciola gigantica]
MNNSLLSEGAFKSRLCCDSILSDVENSMDTMPGTPLGKCAEVDNEAPQPDSRATPTHPVASRRDSRIKSETMLSRVGSFVTLTDAVNLDDIFEYDWADSDSESPDGKLKESYMVQELLADYLKVKSFKRKYPDLARRTMDAYERSWLQQEGLVPVGRADLGLTALRTDEVMRLLQDDYPEVHAELSGLFQRRRFQQAVQLQKRQYEAARIERGEARAEAARRRALDSASDFNHRLVGARLTTRQCYWDLQTMQIHFPQRQYKLIQSSENTAGSNVGSYPVAVIPGQFAEHFTRYTPEQLMHLPLSRCIYSQPSRRHRDPPPLPPATHLRFGSLAPQPQSDRHNQPESFKIPGPECGTTVTTAGVAVAGENRSVPHTSNKEPKLDGIDPNRQTNPSPVTWGPLLVNSSSQSANFPSSTARTVNPPSSDRRVDQAKSGQFSSLPNGAGNEDPIPCSVCKQEASAPYVQCSECKVAGHPRCFSLPDSMLPGVMSYAWSCMECKRCVECSDSGNEEQMMFCDRCDRGYHVFCVGLKKIPHGNWDCPLCVPQTSRTKRRRSSITSRRRPGENRAKRPRKARKRSISTMYDGSNDEESVRQKPSKMSSAKRNVTDGDNDNDRVPRSEQEIKPKRRPRRKQRPRMIIDDSLLTTSSDEASLTQGSFDSTSLIVRSKCDGTVIPRRRGRPRKAEQTESEDAETTRSSLPSRSSKPRSSKRTKTSSPPSPVELTQSSPTATAHPVQLTESVEKIELEVTGTEKEQSPPAPIDPAGDSDEVVEPIVKEAAEVESALISEDSTSSKKHALTS